MQPTSLSVASQLVARNSLAQTFRDLFSRVLIFKSLIAFLLNDSSLNNIGDLTHGLLGTSSYQYMAQYLSKDPSCAVLISERYMPPSHDLDALLALPHDSLGYIRPLA